MLQVFTALGVGGAETWLIALLKYLREHEDELPCRVRFDICLTGGFKADFDDEAAALGARLFYLPYSIRKLLPFALRFRALLRRGRYHAVHDHQDYAAGLRFLFGLGLLPAVRVVHVHNPILAVDRYISSPLRRAWLAMGKSLTARWATHIAGTSRQILAEYGFDEPAFSHIEQSSLHCGFDVSSYNGGYDLEHAELCRKFGWGEDSRIVLFVGRLEPQIHKNPKFALEIARACHAQDPRVRLLMAGAGDAMKAELEDAARSWGLENQVRMLGVRSDVPRLMRGSDLLLFPSTSEGLGMVAVEAQAAGLPVLTSDGVPRECVVVPEMVTFRPLADGVAAWAEQAARIISEPRPEIESSNLAVKQSEFSIDHSAAKLLRIYRGHLEPHQPTSAGATK